MNNENESCFSFLIRRKVYLIILFSLVIIIFLIVYFTTSLKTDSQETYIINTKDYTVLRKLKRDTTVFTQGLAFDQQGFIIESTGLYGESKLLKYNLDKPDSYISNYSLNNSVFGEGATLINNTVYQLTWQERDIYVYDNNQKNFILKQTYSLPKVINEGWGITYDNQSLIICDGSNIIYFLDPNNMLVQRNISVTDNNGHEYHELNELEYVNRTIYANVWYTNYILLINPNNGVIKRKIDFTDLYNYEQNYSEYNLTTNGYVFNGIAYDKKNDLFVLTGKEWKHLYIVKIN